MTTAIGTVLSEVRQRLPLAEYLVSKGYVLRQTGRNRTVALCPFHADKRRPNMVIYTDEQRFHCFACLEEDELVWTVRGLTRIGAMQVGDLVLDSRGEFKHVTAKAVRSGNVLGVETGAFRGDPLQMTPDHLCLFVRDFDAIKALPYIYHTLDGHRIRMQNNVRHRRKGEVHITVDRAERMRPGDFLLFPVIPDELRSLTTLDGPRALRGRGKSKKLVPVTALPASKETAWLYGMWLAEGSVSGGRVVRFAFGAHERQTLVAQTHAVLSNLGFDSTVFARDSRCEVLCSRVDLARHLVHWFGSGVAQKMLPGVLLRWSRDLQRAFLDGYLAGDGDRRRGTAKTVSPTLAYGLFALMVQAGMLPSMSAYARRVGRDGVQHRPHWAITAVSVPSLDGFFEEIDGVQYYWSQIRRINPRPGTRTVVDISVEKSGTFVTKMCAVHNCGARGDVVDMAQHLEGHLDFTAALRTLADKLRVPWPDKRPSNGEDTTGVLTLAAKLYAEQLSSEALAYLGSRGFPEPFVRKWRIGYASPKLPQFLHNLLKQHRITPEAALASGVVVKVRSRDGHYVRDFFGNSGGAYIVFPNPGRRGVIVDLQGRAFPGDSGKPKYLNLPKGRRHLFNESILPQASVVLAEGIPDALSCMLVDQPAVAVYGTGGFSDRFVNQFARCRRVYVTFDLDVHDRNIEVAMGFGLRGRVLVLPDRLGRKGDLNDLLVQLGPERFCSELQRLMATAETGYAMAISRLPDDLHVTDVFETAAPLLAAIGALDPVSRDAHLHLFHVKYGVGMDTLRDAAHEALIVLPSTSLANGLTNSGSGVGSRVAGAH